MTQLFRTGFGSKADAQRCHQPTVRKLVAHLNSNCKTLSPGDVARRAEMVIVLQQAVDSMLTLDGLDILGRPDFNENVTV